MLAVSQNAVVNVKGRMGRAERNPSKGQVHHGDTEDTEKNQLF
jgi:hypothetical protein